MHGPNPDLLRFNTVPVLSLQTMPKALLVPPEIKASFQLKPNAVGCNFTLQVDKH